MARIAGLWAAAILCILSFPGAASAFETAFIGDVSFEKPLMISAVATDPQVGKTVVLSADPPQLVFVDTDTRSVPVRSPLPHVARAMAIDAERHQVLVAMKGGILAALDVQTTSAVYSLALGFEIESLCVSPDGSKAILLGDDGILRILELSNHYAVKEVRFDGKPMMASFLNDRTVILIATGSGATSSRTQILLIDPANAGIVASMRLNDAPLSMAADPRRGLLLLGFADKGVVVNSSLHPIGEIRLPAAARDVTVNPSTGIAVALHREKALTMIDMDKASILTTLALEHAPAALALDPARNLVVVAQSMGLTFLKLENPVPAISRLVPDSATAASGGLRLSVEGERFVKESESLFGTRKVRTSFEADGKLSADIQPSDLMVPGNVPVRVSNPPPGGGLSNSLSFRILNALPRIEGISPSAAGYGGGTVELIVRGQNFLPSSYVTFNGRKFETHFVSSIVLRATVDLKGIDHSGRYPVMVTNPSQVSLTSNAAFLSIASGEAVAAGQDAAMESKDADTEAPDRRRRESGKLTGRILNTHKEPVEGVLVRVKGQSAYTDADGRFELSNVPSGKAHVMVHGPTAIWKWVGKEPHEHFPTIPLTVDVAPNAATAMPYDLYLHRQKNRNFVPIQPRRDSVLTDDEHPGVELKIPAGVNIIGWDGKRNEKISMRNVPPDRLPLKPLPANASARSVYMFHFDKVGGGTADRPVPFKAPNDLGLLPGEKAVLWYYDESPQEGEAPNDWAVAGTGTVTADGKYIVSDPGVGIPKFCCGATAWGGSGAGSPPSGPAEGGDPDDADSDNDTGDPGNPSDPGNPGNPANPENDPEKNPPNECGDPVNLATGYFMHKKIDYSVPGIIPVKIKRYYRSGDNGYGAFGKGTYFGYDWFLQKFPDMLRLIKPGNYQYSFNRQPDGSFTNAQDPKYRGDVFYKNSDNTYTLKRKNGWQYTFGTDSLLDAIRDPNGNKLTFRKLVNGNISQIITPEGWQIDITYKISSRDNITSITGPFGTVNYNYYSTGMEGKLKSVQYPDGTSISYQYDSAGRMTQIFENGNLEVTNEYDSENRITRQTHVDGGTYTYRYTIAGGNITETTMTTPNISVTTWRFYDDSGAYRNGYVTKMITEGGTTTYDRQPGTNQILSVTDRLGRETGYTYYANGQVKSKTDSLGNTTSYEYEPYYGRLSRVTNALGQATTYTYVYDSSKRISQMIIRDALSNATTIHYNEYGLKTGVTDANGNVVSFLYENASLPTRVTQIVDPLGNATRFAYDTLGRAVRITDAEGTSTQHEYDNANRLTAVTDANGNTTRYTYDGPNLTQVMDPKGGTIRYAYDARNRLIKMTDPLGREETYTYYSGTEITPTTGDNLKSVTDRKGQTTTFDAYDARNRVTRKTYYDGSYTAYAYDEAGRLSAIDDSLAGAVRYTYTDFGCTTGCSGSGVNRVSEESTPLGTIAYTYDALGRRASMTVAGEPSVHYSYYDNGRLRTISREIHSVLRSYTLSYDSAGRRTSLKVPTAAPDRYITSTYGYDTANRLTGILHEGPSSTIESLLYTYDATERVSKYSRNAVQPLRPSATGMAYNAANEMLSFTREGSTAKAMSYDANGNLASVTDACGMTTYTWDARNRLVGINGYKADCSSLVAVFSYDALNRRISKTVNGVTTQYLYDGQDIIQEISASGAKTNYVRTLRIDEPLTRIHANGTIRHYVGDRLGSVISLVDDNGATRTTYAYDPFGNVTVTGEAADNPFQYTGRENDGTGLYYYRARYYSPELQRFISRDPIGLSGGDLNFYRYVGNSPVKFTDSLGLFCGPGKLGDLVIPDSWWGMYSFARACERHDACYDKCGMKKSTCDNIFMIDMLTECAKLKNLLQVDCVMQAMEYYWAVRLLGDIFYNGGEGK